MPPLSRSQLATRREEAVNLSLAGESPASIAKRLGVHRSRVYAWLSAYRQQGQQGILPKVTSGRPASLNDKQRQQLREIVLNRSPGQANLEGTSWTSALLQKLIDREFTVAVSLSTAKRLFADFRNSPEAEIPTPEKNISPPNKKHTLVASEENIADWALLLQQSLLDEQQPFALFLAQLSRSLKSVAIILPNLRWPTSPIRSTYKDMDFEGEITLNKIFIDTWHDNPFITALDQPSRLCMLSDLIKPSQWRHNDYCRNMLMRMGNDPSDMLGLGLAGPDNTICGLLISKNDTRAKFTHREKLFVQKLRLHLEAALSLTVNHWRSTFTVKALEEATDHLEIAVFVLDGEGKVIKANGTAEEMLGEADHLKLNNRWLDFLSDKHRAAFKQAMEKCIAWRQAPRGSKPVEALRFNYGAEDWLGVLIQPITPPSLSAPHSTVVSPHMVVYISDPAKPRPTPQHQLIMRLFQLSVREANLTTLLANDHSLEEAAKKMHITQATARTYLQHIFEKVGVNRRQDLVQRVMKSVALLG